MKDRLADIRGELEAARERQLQRMAYSDSGLNRITAHSIAREHGADMQTIREQCERAHEARRVALETYKREAFARPASNPSV